ncbi:MAG TPA: hypothetical protein VGI39_22170, partial [Polyangiaceae bacterium]
MIGRIRRASRLLVPASLALALPSSLALLACSSDSSSPWSTPDASASETGAPTADSGPPPSADATTPLPDASSAADAGNPDVHVPPSDAGEGGSPEASIGQGIAWPPGRSFPTFPAVTSLDVADLTNTGT